ncbi:unnamed protein product [Alternaria alternata]
MGDETSPMLLQSKLRDLLDRRRTNSTLRNLTLPVLDQTDFSSNDFLSLSTSPELKSSYLQELQRTSLPLGSGGSRLLDGNSIYAEQLEQEIACFHGAESGLLFNSGFDANAGFFASVPQPGDVIVYDELVHASVHDGMRLSRAAKVVAFEHNSVSALKQVLLGLLTEQDGVREGRCNVFVALESIYSMDGDVCPLKQMVEVVEEVLGHERGYIVMDEAHSTGVLGPEAKPKVLASFLQSHSMMVRAVVPPTVPVGTARVRICLHAGNTFADLERLVELLGEWCESQAAEMLQDNTLEPVTRAKL